MSESSSRLEAPPGWERRLAGADLAIPAVTAGGAPLGSMPETFGYEVADRDAVELVRQLLTSPIHAVDTANGYSDGESERRIGIAVREAGGLPPGFLVSTKVDAAGGDYSAARVRASVDESRSRLGLDVLPLVHLHDPEFFDAAELTAPGGAVDALVALKEAGVIGALGIAGGDVRVIGRYVGLGVFDVLLTHNRYTLVDRSADALIDAARARGMGVMNAAVYGGGILAGAGGKPGSQYGYRAAPPELLRAIAGMSAVCERHGVSLATAALGFSLRDPRIDSTVVGISKPGRIAGTLAAAGVRLPDGFWAEVEAWVPAREHWLDAAEM